MKLKLAALLAIAIPAAVIADLSAVVPYTVPVETAKPLALSVMRGESVTWQFSFTEGGAAKNLTGAEAVAMTYTRTGVVYSVDGAVYGDATGGVARVSWASTNATPAGIYDYVVSVSANDYALCRARGQLTIANGVTSGGGIAPTWSVIDEVAAEAALREAGDAAERSSLVASGVVWRAELQAGDSAAASASTNYTGEAIAGLAVDGLTAYAYRLIQSDTNAWLSVEDGTNWVYTVANTEDRIYIVSTNGPWSGPPPGTVFATQPGGDPFYSVPAWTNWWSGQCWSIGYFNTELDGGWLIGITEDFSSPVWIDEYPADPLPLEITGGSGGGPGSAVIDWQQLYVTNRTVIATTNDAHNIGTALIIAHSGASDPHGDRAYADANFLAATPGWFWQGSQQVITNTWIASTNGYATYQHDRYELVPYTTSRHDVTGEVTVVSDRYIINVVPTWFEASSTDDYTPKTPMYHVSSRSGPTSWVLRAWCSVRPSDANPYYYSYASNVIVYTYDRSEMAPNLYTNDAAGIVARTDNLPGNGGVGEVSVTTDPRRVINADSLKRYIDQRKTEIADEAWNRTPGGYDVPDRRMVTIDEPLVQQGAISYLQSGDHYVFSYVGGDWYNATTGSVWRIGPSGRTAFEISATNRMLHVQSISVSSGYVTLDISTNWVVNTPSIEFTSDLLTPQWLACPSQTMTDYGSYWRGVCPGVASQRFFRVVSPGGENVIRSHFRHEFLGPVTLFGVTYNNLTELRDALEALP